ncbi:MAG TPA: dihydroorotate dehydrogenase-like protein [Rhodopila sp.]
MDLATTYLGLRLEHPLVASSSPLTGDLDSLRRLEDAGAAAVVLPSIFEQQIDHEAAEHERLTSVGTESFAEASSWFPVSAAIPAGPHDYLNLIRRARAALAIPVIASLNCSSVRGWSDYSRLIAQAGASALELNSFSVPVEADLDGGAVEQSHLDVLRSVKAAVTLPVAIKLSPYFSAVGDMVRRLDRAGASGFVLFNRFYLPDIDLASMRVQRDLALSAPADMRLPLLWTCVLAGQVDGSIAATSGVDSADQVIKYLLAGADVVMTASALLRHGIGHMGTLLNDLSTWLDSREVTSIGEIRGRMSRQRLDDPMVFEHGNYISIPRGRPARNGWS